MAVQTGHFPLFPYGTKKARRKKNLNSQKISENFYLQQKKSLTQNSLNKTDEVI